MKTSTWLCSALVGLAVALASPAAPAAEATAAAPTAAAPTAAAPTAAAPEAADELHGSLSLGLRGVTVEDSEGLYREHHGRTDGLAGGVEAFSLHNSKVSVEGSGLLNEGDYRLSLELKPAKNFVVYAGAENARSFYSDRGGYLAGVNPRSSYGLDEDLRLDIGRLWVKAGLQGDDVPTVLVGYEYRYRQGEKSMLEWNRAGAIPAQVYPAMKDIDEAVHILTLDVETKVGEVNVADNLRYEIYENDVRRSDVVPATVAGTATGHTVDEGASTSARSNSIALDSWVTDWLLLSGGYMYFDLSGEADYRMATMPSLAPTDKYWFTNQVDLAETSHVANLGAFVKLLDKLTLSLGLQAEDTGSSAEGPVDRLEGSPAVSLPLAVDTATDLENYREEAELRFSGIPWTVLYAKGSLEQGDVNHREQELMLPGHVQEMLRDTDEDKDQQQYRLGGTFSPCRFFSANAYYQRTDRENDYDHGLDESAAGVPDLGYSAYLQNLRLASDEYSGKLTFRFTRWLRTALQYQRFDTVTDNDTEAGVTPGGEATASEYGSDRYSANVVVTPVARLLLSATYAYEDTTTRTEAVRAPALLAEYEGNVHTVLTSAQYTLSACTKLDFSCLYSLADNDQGNGGGVPQGTEFRRQELRLGVTHAFSETLTGKVQYLFASYDDGHYDNDAGSYTAHGIYTALTMRF